MKIERHGQARSILNLVFCANSPRDFLGLDPHGIGLHDIDQLRFCFAKVIARRRMRKGWSQADLAGFCGLERSYVSRLEKGLRTPSLDVVFRFGQAFGVAPHTLVKEVHTILSETGKKPSKSVEKSD